MTTRAAAPSVSWWLEPMTRSEFQAACEQIPLRYLKPGIPGTFDKPKKPQQRITATIKYWTA